MHITDIKIKNFQRISHVDVALSAITLFAGFNESGKSTMLEAVRFGALGESPRVSLKKNYGYLVARGASQGTIQLSTDEGVIIRHVKDGKRVDGDDIRAVYSETLPFVMGAQSLGAMPYGQRRATLLSLLSVSAERERVEKMLAERGVNDDVLKAVMPQLRAGWDAMRDKATGKARELKGEWRSVTGETWGENKGAEFEVSVPSVPKIDADAYEAELQEWTEKLESVQQQIGAARERERQAEQGGKERERLQDLAERLAARQHLLKEARERTADASERMDKASAARHVMHCPGCKAALVREGDELVFSDDLGEDAPDFDEAVSAYNAACDEQAATEAKVRESERAKESLDNMSDTVAGGDSPSVEALTGEAREAQDGIAGVREKLNSYRERKRAADEAEQANVNSKRIHAQIMSWLKVADEVSPEGVPGELLKEALAPLNERLQATEQRTGWARVYLASDGSITVDNLPYELLSESAKWRVDAALAEALAWVVGPPLLMLDRVDVLDLKNRGVFAKWLQALGQEYADAGGTILCAGTFKAKPSIPGVATHWVENGKIEE